MAESSDTKFGPLSGFTIIEMAGIGPCPLAGQILGDLGADVIVVDRPGGDPIWGMAHDVSRRNKRSVALNLKSDAGLNALRRLITRSDALLEGFRPGVMERLGLAPDACLELNPKLVFGRMTGWGQEGPLAKAAGHDINYIAVTGALHAMGESDRPPKPPLNLVGDFGGGAMFLVTGILAGLLEANSSGKGQIVDAAMTDGTAILASIFTTFRANGFWHPERGTNLIDGGAHHYGVYETRDGGYVSVGALEPQFYAELVERMQLDPAILALREDRARWPQLREQLQQVFLRKTRDEWCEVLEGTDVCFAPVLTFEEAPHHPHNVARNSYTEVEGHLQPSPAPRFNRTPGAIRHGAHESGADTRYILEEAGFSGDEILAVLKSND